jgi:8-oxo-dGTP pyrophosphatase MutT (NUDIX family)
LAAAAIRRLKEETGLVIADLVPAGAFTYWAVDDESGLVEHEHDHVFAAIADTSPTECDPAEIGELARLPFLEALGVLASNAGTPWAPEVLLRSSETLAIR